MDFVLSAAAASEEETQADVQREIDVMQRLKRGSCDNVVRMFDYGWEVSGMSATIVMEFVEYGSFLEYLRWSGGLTQVSHSALGLHRRCAQVPCGAL